MHTKPLHLFITLAETLHFGRASQLCHLSPSALSRNIRQLEEQLGVTLFKRDNRQVSLTSEGALFLEYARQALQNWHDIRQRRSEERRVGKESRTDRCVEVEKKTASVTR